MPSTRYTTCLLAFTSFSYFVAQSVYCMFLHPLAKVPGPWYYALSNVFYLRHYLRGGWESKLKSLHDKYGPVVRFTSNEVSFITAGAWKALHGHKMAGQQSYDKDPIFVAPEEDEAPHIINADNDNHRRMRRVIAHAFSEKALHGQEEIIKGYIDLFIKRMAENAAAAKPIDIVLWYNFTTFDVIGDLAFGEPFGMLEKGVYHPWIAMVLQSVKMIAFRSVMNRYPVLKPLARAIVPKEVTKSWAENLQLTRKVALQRVRSGNQDREDFMSYILRNNDSDDEKVRARGLSEEEIVSNSMVIIIAGSETTATLLSGVTFQLLRNPDKYQKVVAEIRRAFASEEEITMVSVNNLRYMFAVFSEGFRMYPPVPVGLARVVPKGGDTIEGYYLPEKTGVSVSQWSAYQSELNFFEPQCFHPERWLTSVNTTDHRFKNDNRHVLQPFSMGPRNCIGKNLAYAEMRMILARLLYNFDLELMPESRDWADQKIFTLWSKGELMVKVTPVKR